VEAKDLGPKSRFFQATYGHHERRASETNPDCIGLAPAAGRPAEETIATLDRHLWHP
jgi:hypothetical protein